MGKIIRCELYRGFRCRSNVLLLLFGLLLVIGQVAAFYQVHINNMQQMEPWILDDGTYALGIFPDNMYESFLGGEGYTFLGEVYYSLLPIIAVLPYGLSYYDDRKSGYASVLISRVGKRCYFSAKILVSVIVGGVSGVFPYLTSLFVNSLIYPANNPNVLSWDSVIIERSLISELYYTHPMVYMMAYAVIIFLVGGILSLSAMLFSLYANVKLVVLFCPYIFYALQNVIFEKTGLRKWAFEVLVFQAKNCGSLTDMSYTGVLGYLLFYIILFGGLFLWKTRKIEVTSLSLR